MTASYGNGMPHNLLALVAALACFVIFLILDNLVRRGITESFDRRGIQALRFPSGEPRGGVALAPAMRLLTQLGGPILRYAIAFPVAISLYWFGLPLNALWLITALGTGWIVDGVVKRVFRRKRPTIVPRLARAGGPSFPSGHTLNGSLVYCAIVIACAPFLGPGFAFALSSASCLSVAIGFSRVWLGVHWPTDVAAGWVLGTGWWLAAYSCGGSLLRQ